jgi:hypothetical protein
MSKTLLNLPMTRRPIEWSLIWYAYSEIILLIIKKARLLSQHLILITWSVNRRYILYHRSPKDYIGLCSRCTENSTTSSRNKRFIHLLSQQYCGKFGSWAKAKGSLLTFLKCNFFHNIGSGSILNNRNTNRQQDGERMQSRTYGE